MAGKGPRRSAPERTPRLFVRLDLTAADQLGPGKVRLLELIDSEGSISAAGRAMRMSYRRAWLLVETLNTMFRDPLVECATGGRRGGGAGLTPLGRRVVAEYRDIERAAGREASRGLRRLQGWSRVRVHAR